MSMQVDFEYPRQVEDMMSIKAAISNFERNMTHMMLLIKQVGKGLESVSQSYEQLTSLSFSRNQEVQQHMARFRQEVLQMQEGVPFQEYNTHVYEEVLAPVQNLKQHLKEAEKTKAMREKRYKKYKKSKEKIDKTEKSYAKKGKPLEHCSKYPAMKQDRESNLEAFKQCEGEFQSCFYQLVEHVEGVADTTMKRYLQLNANYFASIIDCLTKTDPTVQEIVEQYRAQIQRERAQSIQTELSRLQSERNTLGMRAGGSVGTGPNSPARERAAGSSTPLASKGKRTSGASSPPVPLLQQTLSASRYSEAASLPFDAVRKESSGPPIAATEVNRAVRRDSACSSHSSVSDMKKKAEGEVECGAVAVSNELELSQGEPLTENGGPLENDRSVDQEKKSEVTAPEDHLHDSEEECHYDSCDKLPPPLYSNQEQ